MELKGLAILSKLGLSMDTEIEGLTIEAADKTNRQNVFQLKAKTADGKDKTFFAGAKSFEEGLLVESNDKIIVNKGFELYTNQQGEVWVRNKSRAQGKIEVVK